MSETVEPLQIPLNGISLKADLGLPKQATGIVLFAHGSGSSRLSPRNRFVAEELQKSGIGTLLFDLLTEKEDEVYENRFDIDLLTERLISATQWLKRRKDLASLTIGYFGASTGSAAALKAAAELKGEIKVIVSRGGRPDMAEPVLQNVAAPTLLIVGGEDYEVIELNKAAFERLRCIKRLDIVPGATHLFAEPNTLEQVAEVARDWFKKYLGR